MMKKTGKFWTGEKFDKVEVREFCESPVESDLTSQVGVLEMEMYPPSANKRKEELSRVHVDVEATVGR